MSFSQAAQFLVSQDSQSPRMLMAKTGSLIERPIIFLGFYSLKIISKLSEFSRHCLESLLFATLFDSVQLVQAGKLKEMADMLSASARSFLYFFFNWYGK